MIPQHCFLVKKRSLTFRRQCLNAVEVVPADHVFVVDVDKLLVDVQDPAGWRGLGPVLLSFLLP
jgi:hypothetical protein